MSLVLVVASTAPGFQLEANQRGECIACGDPADHHVRFGVVVVPHLSTAVDQGWRCADCRMLCQFDEEERP